MDDECDFLDMCLATRKKDVRDRLFGYRMWNKNKLQNVT